MTSVSNNNTKHTRTDTHSFQKQIDSLMHPKTPEESSARKTLAIWVTAVSSLVALVGLIARNRRVIGKLHKNLSATHATNKVTNCVVDKLARANGTVYNIKIDAPCSDIEKATDSLIAWVESGKKEALILANEDIAGTPFVRDLPAIHAWYHKMENPENLVNILNKYNQEKAAANKYLPLSGNQKTSSDKPLD